MGGWTRAETPGAEGQVRGRVDRGTRGPTQYTPTDAARGPTDLNQPSRGLSSTEAHKKPQTQTKHNHKHKQKNCTTNAHVQVAAEREDALGHGEQDAEPQQSHPRTALIHLFASQQRNANATRQRLAVASSEWWCARSFSAQLAVRTDDNSNAN